MIEGKFRPVAFNGCQGPRFIPRILASVHVGSMGALSANLRR
jgi:hypothetical protein